MRKQSHLTVTDQFCGAGGSSQGVRLAAQDTNLGTGLEVKLAMNHWKIAIETHNTNFPEAEHVLTNISSCDPRRYISTDILITSPECTVHSPAGGGQAKKKKYGNQLALSGKLASDDAEERSRVTMWDVCRFAEYHKYRIIIVENVIEARSKWPLFDVWLQAMQKLGYDFEIKYINSMHAHPTPQSRDRMYCVFWLKTQPKPDLEFKPMAPCNKCLKNIEAYQWWKPRKKKSHLPPEHGKYRLQYLFKCPDCHEVVEPYFHAAFNVIDWTKPGTRIGDKKPALVPKTLERCQYGIDKFWPEPSIINVKYSSGVECRVKSADEALSTQPGDAAIGVLNPCIVSGRYIEGISNRVKSSEQALPVQMTDGRESVLFPPLIGSTDFGIAGKIKPATEEMFTTTTQQNNFIATPPLLLDAGWTEKNPRIDNTMKDPMSTQDTGQTKGLLFPFLVKNYSGDHHNTLSTSEPLGTITRHDHHSIVNHPLVIENYGQSKAKSSYQSLGAIAGTTKQGIITPEAFNSFLSYYNGKPQASHILESMDTIPCTDRIYKIDYKKPRLEDCYYRMLLPHEIQLGMAFDTDYIVLGDSKQKVKQLGNAVTPPVMRFLVRRCVQSLL